MVPKGAFENATDPAAADFRQWRDGLIYCLDQVIAEPSKMRNNPLRGLKIDYRILAPRPRTVPTSLDVIFCVNDGSHIREYPFIALDLSGNNPHATHFLQPKEQSSFRSPSAWKKPRQGYPLSIASALAADLVTNFQIEMKDPQNGLNRNWESNIGTLQK